MTYKTVPVNVGGVIIGGGQPVIVQSMTNTDTADRKATVAQIIELADSGSEIVRITVNTPEAAKQVAGIKQDLLDKGYTTPLVGCFHYNGHTLLTDFEDMAKALDKYRINPGNVGFGNKRDKQFEIMIQASIKHNKPVRIGVNWGSLDQAVLTTLMDENIQKNLGKTSEEVLEEALIMSALSSAELAKKIGQDKIIISCKVSKVKALVRVYRELAKRCNYPLHLGLTEAGMGMRSIAATSSALGVLLLEGIGDTIRASLTPDVGGDRANEVKLCKDILQSLDLRSFTPQVTACPGCGRTTSSFFQELADKITKFLDNQMNIWKETHPGAAALKVAVMGCIVNGPGESKHSDIGISLPGTGESPVAPVFIDGVKTHTLRGANIAEDFIQIVTQYVEKKYAKIEV